jgi:hypothetical protein
MTPFQIFQNCEAFTVPGWINLENLDFWMPQGLMYLRVYDSRDTSR